MATGTVTNVSVGKPGVSGSVAIAPLGTTLPTDATTALGNAFTYLGYVSEDGVTNSNSPESDTGKAWGGDIVIAFQTGKEDTFTFTLIESLNADVLKSVYGDDNVSGTLATGLEVSASAADAEELVYVIDMVMRDGAQKRIVIPDGKLTELGDIVYADEDIVGYEETITAFPDASGNTHYEYIKKTA